MSDKIKLERGRPGLYKPEMCEQVYRRCLLGATNEDLAEMLGITTTTIQDWKHKHPDFSAAIKAGKEEADEKVADSLYNQALSGNTTAQIFWLKNRQSKSWREKTEIDHTSAGEKIQGINVKFVE